MHTFTILCQKVATIRCWNHTFLIETGWHLGITRDQNVFVKYYLLNLNVQCTAYEFHVFFICNQFWQLRQPYLLNWYAGMCVWIWFLYTYDVLQRWYNQIFSFLCTCLWDIILKLYMPLLKLYFIFYYDLRNFWPVAYNTIKCWTWTWS